MLDFARPETLPTRRTEAWRYSDLRAAVRSLKPIIADNWDKLLVTSDWESETRETPHRSEPLAEAARVNEPQASVLTVEAGQSRDLALDFEAIAGVGHCSIIIDIGRGAECRLAETYWGKDTALANVVLHISLGAGASLTRTIIQNDAGAGVILSTAYIDLEPGARFAQTTFAAGGRLVRMETHVAHPGAGAEVRLDGVYLLADRRHADLTSVVTHMGRDGSTTQLTKGVVRDAARGVFQGRIVVEEGADGTDARMGHHALLLSDRAEVDAKPELEIFADDVSCAHGNTVGALDEEALFYAQSRGLPLDAARALLVEAFVGEVVDRIEHEGAREIAREWVSERLKVTP